MISNNFDFFESSKLFLTNMVTLLMMSAKVATLRLLKTGILRKEVMTPFLLSMTPTAKFYRVT